MEAKGDNSTEPRSPGLDDFLVEPTRDLEDWRWLWSGDHAFPIRSHRGFLGRLLVGFKRLLRPLVKTPQNDLWERQRTFNLILIEHLERLEAARADHLRRIEYQEALDSEGIHEVMRHNDALFARADQKLDRYRREARDLLGSLGAALSTVRSAPPSEANEAVETIARAHEEHGYLELERRYRGTEEEIRERIAAYLPYLKDLPGPVLDLGCGRGEALALLRDHGIAGRGVDSSERMVQLCRDRGLEAEVGDLFAVLAEVAEGSLGGVISFHVIEHLPGAALDRLVRLAGRALRPGGVLILETPNPLSVVVAACNFWLDPTHVRPVHPESLKLMYELAGFDPVERLDLRPFPDGQRLPEIELATLPPEQRPLADLVNRLRDRLDEVLFGYQDFGMVGRKANPHP
ncbi:MAG TPA: class I SAM-dependent methyltransferase [Thermoanaerobaculia bacterium]|jgi:O-antigen chain-terminating methyltransferase|nr:class I SAM-dependent methyltransferase [Thermoanaerobaculia bacterium]